MQNFNKAIIGLTCLVLLVIACPVAYQAFEYFKVKTEETKELSRKAKIEADAMGSTTDLGPGTTSLPDSASSSNTDSIDSKLNVSHHPSSMLLKPCTIEEIKPTYRKGYLDAQADFRNHSPGEWLLVDPYTLTNRPNGNDWHARLLIPTDDLLDASDPSVSDLPPCAIDDIEPVYRQAYLDAQQRHPGKWLLAYYHTLIRFNRATAANPWPKDGSEFCRLKPK